MILAIHTHDELISAINQSFIKKLLAELHKKFEVTFNEINTYLGLQIERLADKSIFLHQEAYIKKILYLFQMENANAVAIPADQNHQLCVETHKSGYKEKSEFYKYLQAVESLMYLLVSIKSDIRFAINKTSQYLEKEKFTGTQ